MYGGWAASNPADTRSDVDVFTGERAHCAGFAPSDVFSACLQPRFCVLLSCRKSTDRDGVCEDQYLRLGRTCWTEVPMDCVHWPPGPSHTEPESKRFLRSTRLVSSRRRRQRAARARRHNVHVHQKVIKAVTPNDQNKCQRI